MGEFSEHDSPLERWQGDMIPEDWLPVIIERIEWEPCRPFSDGVRQIDFGVFLRVGVDSVT